LIEINHLKLKMKMLGISLLDTILLYTLAAIGVSTIVSKFYHSLELYISLLCQNVEYYLPSVYHALSRWIPRQASSKTKEQMEAEVMDDILSKTKGYYHSINQVFQSQIKNIPDPQLRNKLDQWYQTINKMIETNDKTSPPSNVKDLKKRMSECADEIYKVLGCSTEVQKELEKFE
jgi:hypothetical protein